MSNNPEINVKRRRKGEEPTKRAQAPVRRPSGGGSGARPGGAAPVSSGGGSLLGSSGGKLGCGGILLVGLFLIVFLALGGGGGFMDLATDSQQPQTYDEPAEAVPTRTPRPTFAASAGGSDQTWLVMLYQDADDQALEQDIFLDLNEAELLGSTDQVTIVSQIDRFRGGYQGSEDWHATRRYLVTQDDDLNRIGSQLLDDLGEVNMADGDTLVDFVTWAVESYPADRYALILSDHGMGWPGGWSDPAPGGKDSGDAPLSTRLQEDSIYLSELDDAFARIQRETGLDKLDLVGMDACLMSQLEVYTALQPYARYAVASEETEPGLGWAYAGFLSQLVNNPGMGPDQLAALIVDTYIDEDERVVNDQARSEFLRQGSSIGSFFGAPQVSAEQLADQLERNITLTAVDLGALGALNDSFNDLAFAMQSIDQQAVASARGYAQSYTSIFGRQVPPSYIDLGHFVQLLAKQSRSADIQQAAGQVLDALGRVVVAERHGKSKPGSTGIAIYFPNSSLYSSPYTGMQSYTMLADRFAGVSLWDDFLVYHYSNRSFKAGAAEPVTPGSGAITRAPGGGAISISGITASERSVSPGEYVELSADITGENIGYVYLFTGLYDAQSNSIYVADTDYLESPDTGELNGVYYPVWPESDTFRMNFEWEPLLFSITDGSQSTLALFNPGAYGASAEDAMYVVEGTYTFAGSGEQRKAELYFKDGKLFQVFGFKGEDTASAPAEITPAYGDTFTLSRKWMDLDSSGSVTEIVYEDGDTLTFTDSGFEWEQVYAPAGEYLVGFLVSDLDGNLKEAYTQLTVR